MRVAAVQEHLAALPEQVVQVAAAVALVLATEIRVQQTLAAAAVVGATTSLPAAQAAPVL